MVSIQAGVTFHSSADSLQHSLGRIAKPTSTVQAQQYPSHQTCWHYCFAVAVKAVAVKTKKQCCD